MSWFQLFGLPESFIIDLDALEKAYVLAQKRIHPDRWTGVSFKTAEQFSAHINKVYAALKDPRKRGEYMLKCVNFWPISSFPKIMQEIFSLKMNSDPQAVHILYQESLIKFDKFLKEKDFFQAQKAYLYICYLGK
ncbi:DnaJ domain-containing protein [Holospora obtusa]|nr:DnaJ domain-containing protein [Holospora obtusa]